MKLVSVIVPIYNVERYLEACVRSIREQTYAELEIILVDDGSPDNCGKMCEEYARQDARVQVIHKKNGGLGDARNTGTRVATGQYILYVDSDDSIHESLVEWTLAEAEQKQADIVLFDYVSVDERGKELDMYSMQLPRGEVVSLNSHPRLLNAAPSAVNKLFRAEFLKQECIEFPVGRYYEDLGTIPKLFALAQRVVYLDVPPLYYYFMRSDSIMHTKNFGRILEDRSYVLNDVIQYFKDRNLYDKYKDELEFLTLENGYFLPCKEIVLADVSNPILKEFRIFMDEMFPDFKKNPYVATFTKKNKILFTLLNARMYRMMLLMSYARRTADFLFK